MKISQPVYVAAATIAPCRFVKPYTGGSTTGNDHKVDVAGAGADPCGISTDAMKGTPGLTGSDTAVAAAAGDQLNVHGVGEVCLLELGGTVNNGDWLKPSTGGVGIATTTSGNIVGARAMEYGISGDKILVQVINRSIP